VDQPGLPLDRKRRDFGDHDTIAEEAAGRFADQNLARLRSLL
jgi:hypothetical protein